MNLDPGVQFLAALVMAGLAGYFLIRMDSADTIIQTLKYGALFLASTLHFLALVYGRRSNQ